MSTMESLSPKLFPSFISRVWRIDTDGNKRLLIPRKKLRWPVTSIVSKITNPILAADILNIERIYYEKIGDFQERWINLLEFTDKGHRHEQVSHMNLLFYDRTLKLIKTNRLFGNDVISITDIIETLKDYEITIQSILNNSNRLKLLEKQVKVKEIDVNDFLHSLYGSYLALVCFWIIARNIRGNDKTIHKITKVSHKLAINLESYTETLDIMTNPDELDMMNHAEKWERQKLKREQELLQNR